MLITDPFTEEYFHNQWESQAQSLQNLSTPTIKSSHSPNNQTFLRALYSTKKRTPYSKLPRQISSTKMQEFYMEQLNPQWITSLQHMETYMTNTSTRCSNQPSTYAYDMFQDKSIMFLTSLVPIFFAPLEFLFLYL